MRTALIDTGTVVSLFDNSVAQQLGLNLSNRARLNITGIGGLLREATLVPIELRLLDEAALTTLIDVAFAPEVELTVGNLLGLDILDRFNFALTHAERVGYLSFRRAS